MPRPIPRANHRSHGEVQCVFSSSGSFWVGDALVASPCLTGWEELVWGCCLGLEEQARPPAPRPYPGYIGVNGEERWLYEAPS